MASRPWSPEDVRILERHMHDDDWLEIVALQFPERSTLAIEVKMSKLRGELGLRGKRGAREEDQDRMNAKSVIASQRLLEATLSVGRWS